MARFVRFFLCLAAAGLGGVPAAPAASPEASFDLVRLIRNEAGKLRDPGGWAADMLSGFADAGIEASRENVCSVVAIVGQESGFVANPQVPGLGRLAEKALRQKMDAIPLLGGRILAWLETVPDPETNFMGRIRAARTERDLDLTYRALLDYAASQTETGFILNSGLLNRYVEERNDVTTIGSMQVSVAFALAQVRQDRWLAMSLADVYAVRDELYTRRGGMKYGLLQLLGYNTGYDRKIYRFADYNAGRYASRNAAFQTVIAALSGERLARDGDLLAYPRPGHPAKSVTHSEKALRIAVARHRLPLSDADIRADLLKEKSEDFAATRTFTLLRETYATISGKAAPFASLPEIALTSIKIRNRMTTAIFAERVNGRYQRCMAVR
jgi:hypothetical protein